MKYTLRAIVLVMIFTLTFVVIISANNSAYAYDESSADSRIMYYNQDHNQSSYYYQNGTYNQIYCKSASYSVLGGNGCSIFAGLHADQWLFGRYSSVEEQTNYARQAVQYLNGSNPANGSNGPDAVFRIMKEHGAEKDWSVNNADIATIEKFFDEKHGALYLAISGQNATGQWVGHYIIAVGYTWHDINGYSTFLLHAIDSCNGATLNRQYGANKDGYHIGDFSYFYVQDYHKGTEYWLPYNQSGISVLYGIYNPAMVQHDPPTSIELSANTTVQYLSDSTYQLQATVYPSDASNRLNWSSSNPEIASVSNTGLVSLLGVGTTVITAQSALDENVKAECFIEVKYNGTGSIQFSGIKYPHVLKSGGSFFWKAGSGTISSDVNLSSIVVNVYQPNGDNRSSKKWENIGKKSVTMEELENSEYCIPMRQITSQGNCYIEIIATDVLGRTLSKGVIFESKSYGANDTNGSSEYVWSFTTNYNDPQLMDSATVNGVRYDRYKASYTWSEAKQYAEHIGGHLATISSAEENETIYSLVRKDNMYGAWIGAYRSGDEWKWVTDEPFTYSNWYTADGEPDKQWGIENCGAMRITEGQWRDSAGNNDNWAYFIVEFEPKSVEEIIVSGKTNAYPGETFTVSATVLPTTAMNKQVVFSTEDSSIVSIDSITGEAVALAEGQCRIIAAAQDGSDVKGEYTVSVLPSPIRVERISIDSIANGQRLCVGDRAEILSHVYPDDAADQGITYFTDNAEVAYVEDYSNVLVCVGEGTCTLTAVSLDNADIADTMVIEISNSEFAPEVRKLMEEPDFITPEDLSKIQEEAFEGIAAARVKLSENTVIIGDYAFATCIDLTQIYLPRSVSQIGDHAFAGCDQLSIVGYYGSEAQRFATDKNIPFIMLDHVSSWVESTSAPENAQVLETKTQYSYREKTSSYSEWSSWSDWSETKQTIEDPEIMQEETDSMYCWWAAQCNSCGQNNPYHHQNCKACNAALNDNDGITWHSVFAYSPDKSDMQTILGRSSGKYIDGQPYWDMNELDTVYRYRTRSLVESWSPWSEWLDASIQETDTVQVNTRTMVKYILP